GPSGCGKSTFARKHFRPTEVVSSDFFRGVVCDDEGNQAASRDAFDLVHEAVARRLKWRRLTVVDATNVQADARKPLLELARHYPSLPAAVVFNRPEGDCQAHNRLRLGRVVPDAVITYQMRQLERTLQALGKEGIRNVTVFSSRAEIDSAVVERV